jgi:hypothetical protein
MTNKEKKSISAISSDQTQKKLEMLFADLVVLRPLDLIKHRAAFISEDIVLEGVADHFKHAIKLLKLDHAAVMSHA